MVNYKDFETMTIVSNRSVRLSSPYVIPHPPTPYVLRAWWTSSTGTEVASGCPPDSRRPPPAEGIRPSWPEFLASPGRRPFLPGPLSPAYPTSHSPTMVRTGRKGFIPTHQTKQTIVSSAISGFRDGDFCFSLGLRTHSGPLVVTRGPIA